MKKKIILAAFLLTSSVLAFSEQEVFIDEAVEKSAHYLSETLGKDAVVLFSESIFQDSPSALRDYFLTRLKAFFSNDGITVIPSENDLEEAQKRQLALIKSYRMEDSDRTYLPPAGWHIDGSLTKETNSKNYRLEIKAIGLTESGGNYGKEYDMLPLTIVYNEQLARLCGDQKWRDWTNKLLWVSAMGGVTPLVGEPPKLIFDAQLGVNIVGVYGVGIDFTANQRIRSSTKELHEGLFTFSVFPLMLNFRFNPFDKIGMEIGFYSGMYYNLPDKEPISLKYGKPAPFGIIAGGDLGFKVGPGLIFFDARVGFWDAWEKDYVKENRALRFMNFGVGYKIGLITK